MKLLYIYFDFTQNGTNPEGYRGYKTCELNFGTDSRYHMEPPTLNRQAHLLAREERPECEKIESGFWGDKRIYNISALVGDNGSGKSMLIHEMIRCLMTSFHEHMTFEALEEPQYPFVFITESANGELYLVNYHITPEVSGFPEEWKRISLPIDHKEGRAITLDWGLDPPKPRKEYGVLRQSYLSIPQKFCLLMAVSKAVEKNGMLDIYERVFHTVVTTSGTCKKLKKNMLLLSAEKLPDINYINGYITADVFMRLWKRECSDYDELFREYVIYLFDHSELIERIDSGFNKSFMDYFIRKCMEDYIYRTSHELLDVYSMLATQIKSAYEVYSRKKKTIKGSDVDVIRHFYDRNFTCAAGNVFSREGYKPTNYEEQYVSAVSVFSQEKQQKFLRLAKDPSITEKQFNQGIGRLIHEVRLEKPAFQAEVQRNDILRNYIVYALKNNERIVKQDGAFILCGLSAADSMESFRYRDLGKKVVLLLDKKKQILEQLETFSINRAALFPEVECVAEYLKNKYSH